MDRLIAYEDEHLLVVRKPPGLNTHASGPYAGEGLYDWLRRRERRWADLAIIQRLDKDTSGILLFSKTRRANVSLTKQFSRRRVEKEYRLLTDREPRSADFVAESRIRKGKGRFESDPLSAESAGLEARTRFVMMGREPRGWLLEAQPLTGRTHQIRLHAADQGIPILGDVLYGGSPWPRLCLHARALRLRHPVTNEPLEFVEEPRFDEEPGMALRRAVIDPLQTTAYRVVHGASDGRPGWQVDRLGDWLLASAREALPAAVPEWLARLAQELGVKGIYGRQLDRRVRERAPGDASPAGWQGMAAPGEFEVRENGLSFRLSFAEGYSTGLFLDQRDNRRRLLTNWVGPDFPIREGSMAGLRVLNVFAYTCGFSVAAAAGGATTLSLDLSRKYLDWGRRNFEANGLDPGAHDFVYGDAFDWLRRFAKKQRRFDVVVLDPPTFSQSREGGVFRAESDYGELVTAAGRVLGPDGVLLASTNAAGLEPEAFLAMIASGLATAGGRPVRQLYVPQPPDFPTSREEAGYLKTVWTVVRSGG